MGKKVVMDVVKGLAISGAAISGASIIGDANLAYAAELDETKAVEETDLKLEESSSETKKEVVVNSQAPVVFRAAPTLQAGSKPQTGAEPQTGLENQTGSETQNGSGAQTSEGSQVVYETVSEANSAADSEMLSTSESMSEVQEIASTSMYDEANNLSQQATNLATSYSEHGYDNEGLDDQELKVDQAAKVVTNAIEKVSNNEKVFTKNNFYNDNVARSLCKEMIIYKLLQDGAVTNDELQYMKINWNDAEGGYAGKYFVVQYIHDNGTGVEYHEDYFDYVTTDKDGNSIYRTDPQEYVEYENKAGQTKKASKEDYAPDVSCLNVIQKVYDFTDQLRNASENFIVKGYKNADGTTKDLEFVRKVANFGRDNKKAILKGTDYYKYTTYLEDVANRKSMPGMIDSLSTAAQDKNIELGNYVNSASTSAELWKLESQNRSTSISNSVETSESESISNSVAASEAAARQAAASSYTYVTSASTSATVAPVATTPVVQPAVEPIAQPAAQAVVQPAAQPVQVARIVDEEVPLAVVDLEEDVETPVENDVPTKQVTSIKDEEVAKAGGEQRTVLGAIWYCLLLIAGLFGLHKVEKGLREKAEK